MKAYIFFLALLCAGQAFAQTDSAVDSFNTYRWNRHNVVTNSGEIEKKPWYEWWFYKVVLPESGESFYFVYGVVNPWDEAVVMGGTRAYVGMGDFKAKMQVEEKYPVSEFLASYDETHVAMRKNVATNKFLTGQLNAKDGKPVSWDIKIEKNYTFNAEGWATGRGLTNIEWYPAQAGATCTGSIQVNGKDLSFTDAPCYQDRNWGSSFPEWWTWIVSNNFEGHPDTVLASGGGLPKVFNRVEIMNVMTIGLKHKGIEYTWRPSDLDKLKVDVSFGKWEVQGINKNHKIEISAFAPARDFMDLQFITPKGEIFHDYETLTGDMTVKLYKRKARLSNKWELIETLVTHSAGIEYGSEKIYPTMDFMSESKTLFSNF